MGAVVRVEWEEEVVAPREQEEILEAALPSIIPAREELFRQQMQVPAKAEVMVVAHKEVAERGEECMELPT